MEMNIISNGDPRGMLQVFDYSRIYFQSRPEIKAEHGTFLFQGKKYFIEFIMVVSEQATRWLVSKVSVSHNKTQPNPELVYHFKEERMPNVNNKRNAFMLVIDNVPILAVCDCTDLVKAYELEDLESGVGFFFGDEFLRYNPKPYEEMLRLKILSSIALGKKYVLLSHEESKEKYDFFANFFKKNNLASLAKFIN